MTRRRVTKPAGVSSLQPTDPGEADARQKNSKDDQKQSQPIKNGAKPLLSPTSPRGHDRKSSKTADSPLSTVQSWLIFALASGACAALNGVFAKLTTTSLTSSLAVTLTALLGLEENLNLGRVVELGVRAACFALNAASTALMWALFTRALTLHASSTRVAIVNTSANFLLTAVLGRLVFAEALPPLWFAGAACLVLGNVIIGRSRGPDENQTAGTASRSGSRSEEL